MSKFKPHEVLGAVGERWLVHLADPARRVPAPSGLPGIGLIETLLAAAESHGVLPAVIHGLAALPAISCDPISGERQVMAAALDSARTKFAYHTGFCLLLSHHAARVTQALASAGVKGAVIKGAAFARHLYPDATLRTFTDVDILVAENQRTDAAQVMRDLGFKLFEFEDRLGQDYHEEKWLLPDQSDVMIEVHSNLVHSPRLRRSMSLGYGDVLDAGDSDSCAPAALLLVAAVHAAVGHQFDRLQHLIDIVQAVRHAGSAIDHARLASIVRRRGVALAVAAALDLAGRTFHDPAALELARLTMPGHLRRLPCRMLSPRLVLRAQSIARARGSWRRKAFRQALRVGS